MRHLTRLFCLIGILLLGKISPALGQSTTNVTADISRDFSTTTNSSLGWSYGWKQTVGGTFTLLTFGQGFGADNGVPIFAWQINASTPPSIARVMGPGTANSAGGQFVAPPGTIYFGPGTGSPQNFGVVRYTVPAGMGGSYTLNTSVRDVFDGASQGDTDFHVARNGVEIFGQFLAPHTTDGFDTQRTQRRALVIQRNLAIAARRL